MALENEVRYNNLIYLVCVCVCVCVHVCVSVCRMLDCAGVQYACRAASAMCVAGRLVYRRGHGIQERPQRYRIFSARVYSCVHACARV